MNDDRPADAGKNEGVPITTIRPPVPWAPINIRELAGSRELIATFVLRDVRLRYKQTALGILWTVIQPLFMMAIFTFIFGGLAKIPSDGIPYPLFVFSALIPWILFSEGLTRSTGSMVANAAIMTKVYFPRLVMPLAGVLSPLVDFTVSFFILLAMMAWFGFLPAVTVVAIPMFVLLALAASLGTGLWLSALNVRFRDFQYTVPFLIQIWFFASPIVYPATLVPEPVRLLYWLNPMAGVIEGFRWALFGTPLPGPMALVSAGIVIILLVTGVFYFRRMEQTYADVV